MDDLTLDQIRALFKQDSAQGVQALKFYLRQHPTDGRGWWVMAQVTEDAGIKRACLEKVLQLHPNHTKAQQALDDLNAYEKLFPPDGAPHLATLHEPETATVPLSSPFSPNSRGLGGFLDVKTDDEPFPSTFPKSKPITPTPETYSGVNRAWLISVGLIVGACVIVIGATLYAYYELHLGIFGLFGPDLDQEATVGDLTIQYPSEWALYQNPNEPTILLLDYDLNTYLQANGFTQETLNANTTDIQSFYLESVAGVENVAAAEGEAALEDFTMVWLYWIPPDINYPPGTFQASLQLYSGLFDSFDFGQFENDPFFDFDIEIDENTMDIDEQRGNFTHWGFSAREGGIFGAEEFYLSYYFATTIYKGREYVFCMIAVEDRLGAQKTLAQRMIASMTFKES